MVAAPVPAAHAAESDIIPTASSERTDHIVRGETNTFTVTLTNIGVPHTVLVDVELKALGAIKIDQKYWDNYEFQVRGDGTFELATPADLDPGTYYFSVGIFEPGWNGMQAWYHRLQEFTVSSPEHEAMGVVVKKSWETKSSFAQGETNEFYAQFHNYAASDQTVLGDLELYDSAGHKVHQVFADNVTIGPAQDTVGGIMSPDNLAPGTYYYSVGVFTPGWGSLIHWYDHLQEFTVN